jgi:dTDP-4-amino-4,6-dideoxygalactose transaminase
MITSQTKAGAKCDVTLNSLPAKAQRVVSESQEVDVQANRGKFWKRLDLDTSLLSVETAIALPTLKADGLKAVIEECAEAGVGLLYWTPEPSALHEEDQILSQPWFTGYAVANPVLFRREVSLASEPLADGESVDQWVVAPASPLDRSNDSLIELGVASGGHSCFRRDPALTRAQFEAMYRAWVCNSINRKTADDVLVCRKKSGEVAGMITLKLVHEEHDAAANDTRSCRESTKENAGEHGTAPPAAVAVIGLLAVSPKFQRQGVGRTLMQAAFRWSRERRARAIEVGTQEENEGAMRFYASQGFEQVSRKTSYHIWIPSSVVGSRVRFNVPYLTGREARHLNDVIENNALDSLGSYTRRCQEWMERTLGSPQALLTHSATAALEQAALLCELKEGDEVVMPSYTFVSTANAVVLRGAVPVFVDANPKDITIDASAIEAAITERTKAIIVVHYAGMPCDMDPIMALAKRRGLYVIEDAAQALLSKYKGKYLGTIGHFGCFSFHYTKNTVCGEGGALLVNDERFLVQSRIVREKGTNRSDFMDNKVAKYEWLSIGSSFEPCELSAAFLLPQLEDAPESRKRRLRVCSAYQSLLMPLEKAGKLTLARVAEAEDAADSAASSGNGHIFWIMFKSSSEREAAEAWMHKHGVQCCRHYVPLHLSQGGQRYARSAGDMSTTIKVGDVLLRLPLWAGMTWAHVHRVVDGLFGFFDLKPPSCKEALKYFTPEQE